MVALQRAAIRTSAGKSAVFRSSAATGKRVCAFQRWRTDNMYGGGGRRATRQLTWSPPALTDPITIKVTNAQTSITMDTSKDYILLLPGAVGNDSQTTPHQPPRAANNGLVISGGRNVVCIGGAVRRDVDMKAGQYVTSSSQYRAARNRAFFIKDWTGSFFMEGVYIAGQHLYENFNISTKAAGAKLFLQNILLDDTCLKSPDWTGESSHDGGDAAVQNWDGPAGGLYVDGFTVRATTYQAFFMQPTQFGAAAPAETILKNVDMDWARPEVTGWPEAGRRLPWPWDGSLFGKGNKMMHFDSTGSVANAGYITFTNFWMNNWPDFGGGTPLWSVNPDPSDPSAARPNLTNGVITYPNLPNVSGQIDVGIPPGGHYVKREEVGIGYVSPGYVGTGPVTPTPPTGTATVTAGTPTSSTVPLSWTSVATATGYRWEYKRTVDSTWTNGATTTGTTATAGNLDPSTAYQFRVYASNAGGEGPVSSAVSATTAAVPVDPGSGENPQGAWAQTYFYDGTSTFNLFNPQNGLVLDTTNERVRPVQSGTAATYYGIAPNGTNGPSQRCSIKISSLTTHTNRASFQALLNVDNVTDAVPQNCYRGGLTYVSATKIATFSLRKTVAGVTTNVVEPVTVDYSARSGVEGLILLLEHRVESNGSHTLELSYDGTVIVTATNVASPLTGVYAGVAHYNQGGGGATSAAQASVDDIRIFGKPASGGSAPAALYASDMNAATPAQANSFNYVDPSYTSQGSMVTASSPDGGAKVFRSTLATASQGYRAHNELSLVSGDFPRSVATYEHWFRFTELGSLLDNNDAKVGYGLVGAAPGITSQASISSGNDMVTGSWSERMTICKPGYITGSDPGGLSAYIYAHYAGGTAFSSYGIRKVYRNNGQPVIPVQGQWYKRRVQVGMNTPGQNDGVYRVWIDDQLVLSLTDVQWIASGQSNQIGYFWTQTFPNATLTTAATFDQSGVKVFGE